ncbi:MAG: SDR family NAD(P)-dependent oxidoreductase [Opitutaceae bacterium]
MNSSSDTLRGKVALVTGAGSGIGAAAAIALGAAGVRVAALSRTGSEVDRTVSQVQEAGGEGLALVGDVSSADAMRGVIAAIEARWGRLDIVVANAGINGVWAPVEEITPEEWDQTMAINLRGTFLTVRESVPLLKKQGGSIIIVSSIQGNRSFSVTGASAYATSKAAQVAFGRMIAFELAASGIRVNTICPGAIHTEISRNSVSRNLDKISVKRTSSNRGIPLTQGIGGEPRQVADTIVFLASDASSHTTGTEVYIDGGQSLQ